MNSDANYLVHSFQELITTLKLVHFCIFNLAKLLLARRLSTKSYLKIETSAQNLKISESAYFAHFPA
jgi:hypothetical protein